LRHQSSGRRRHILLGAVCIAALVFSHPGYAFWSVFFLSLYVLVHVGAGSRRGFPVRDAISMIALGLLLSSCLTVPMWMEQAWTGVPGFAMALHEKPTLTHLLA
jgi:hypothetical protein